MSAEYFLDTNVIVYAFDQKADKKRMLALELLEASPRWAISWQVVQEFCAVALHRFAIPLEPAFLAEWVDVMLLPHCKIMPSGAIYKLALQIHRETGYRYYDSLVVASALESGARILYSEDMQSDRLLGGLRIVNPFQDPGGPGIAQPQRRGAR